MRPLAIMTRSMVWMKVVLIILCYFLCVKGDVVKSLSAVKGESWEPGSFKFDFKEGLLPEAVMTATFKDLSLIHI